MGLSAGNRDRKATPISATVWMGVEFGVFFTIGWILGILAPQVEDTSYLGSLMVLVIVLSVVSYAWGKHDALHHQ
jgi:hypothetical protein